RAADMQAAERVAGGARPADAGFDGSSPKCGCGARALALLRVRLRALRSDRGYASAWRIFGYMACGRCALRGLARRSDGGGSRRLRGKTRLDARSRASRGF